MSRRADFVHLHVHTEYSMLDGAARLTDLFTSAAEMGMPAVAMTDHGNVYGAYDFWKRGKAAGVKPIIGMEGYYAPQGRREKSPFDFGGGPTDHPTEDGGPLLSRGHQAYTHITLIAETTEGMHNLSRLSSLASSEGYYRKPRFDRELLERYGKDLIATTGCPSSEVNRWLQAGEYDSAMAAAADFRDIFGPGNFYVELMDHGANIERRHRGELLTLARDLRLPMIATNDVHYLQPQDAAAHELLLCIGTHTTIDNPRRFRLHGSDYSLKSGAEMRETWRDYPEACDNTLLIAERCNVAFVEGANLMPTFPVPEGQSEESWLRREVVSGLTSRFAPARVPDSYRKRTAFELELICQMGFSGYFLIAADLVRFARESGIRVGPGRGSAPASLVAYALGITELDPVEHGLLLERFLNPERISKPDIDLDFDQRRRDEVIAYVRKRYGDRHVARLVSFSTLTAKVAIRESARTLGMPSTVATRIIQALPAGRDVSLPNTSGSRGLLGARAADGQATVLNDPDAQHVIDVASRLKGLKRHPAVHPSGLVISDSPLVDVIPLWRREQDGVIITQFDSATCEALGLVKLDILGLKALAVIDDCLLNIEANRGETIVLEDLELDDRPTYELLARGDTLGVFQLDGGPMRALLRSMQPDNFEDISAVLALYRPGPMGANAHNDYADRKNNRKPVEPIHPDLAEPLADILGDTYGLIVYQEQVMAIAQQLAGYSLGKADLLRRAMGKKKKEILDAEFVPFHDGMVANGYSEESIKKLWEILVPFSDYAFNKAHATAYGVLTYRTAYLKANYPDEYMQALLGHEEDNDKHAEYRAEARRMGIKVLRRIRQAG